MKTVCSLSLLLCFLWGAAAADAYQSTVGAVIPAHGDPQAPLTLDVLIMALPPTSCPAKTCHLWLEITFVMTDGQTLRVSVVHHHRTNPVRIHADIGLCHLEEETGILCVNAPSVQEDHRLVRGWPLRIRAAPHGNNTRLVLTWGGRRLVETFDVRWTTLTEVQVLLQVHSLDPTGPQIFDAQVWLFPPPPVVELVEDPSGPYTVHFEDALLTIHRARD